MPGTGVHNSNVNLMGLTNAERKTNPEPHSDVHADTPLVPNCETNSQPIKPFVAVATHFGSFGTGPDFFGGVFSSFGWQTENAK